MHLDRSLQQIRAADVDDEKEIAGESTHGLGAYWEHWWCPIPLALIVVGLVGLAVALVLRRPSPSA